MARVTRDFRRVGGYSDNRYNSGCVFGYKYYVHVQNRLDDDPVELQQEGLILKPPGKTTERGHWHDDVWLDWL